MDKINVNDFDGGFDFDKIRKKTFVDVNKELKQPPLAISIGSHIYKGYNVRRRFGTYGNFSVIKGPAKSRKSFLKSLITAAYIGGSTIEYAEDIKSHRNGSEYVLDFDTEQSEFDSQNVFNRTCEMVGFNYANYIPHYLRSLSYLERLQFIEYYIMESEYKNNLGLVIIDGIADLVSESNDQVQANYVTGKLMEWTDKSQCHLITIIHTNPGTEKATGHLGTIVQRKAETICLTEYNDKSTIVKFKENRGFPIDDFSFSIGSDGLPRTSDLIELTY